MAEPPPMVSFASLPTGWDAFQGGGAAAGAYATSWRYRPNRHGWAGSMPRGGIVVTVFFPLQSPRYRPLERVLPTRAATTLEGAPDTPEYRIHGRVRGRDVEVWVDIRQPHPTKAQLRVAQRVVSGVRFSRNAGS